MTDKTGYVLIVSMDVEATKENLFNEVYDEHAEQLRAVPGVRSVERFKGEPFKISIGGEIKSVAAPDPVYTAIYELETPEVLQSEAWASAVEQGRWADEIRPHTRNRSHALFRKLGSRP